MKHNLYKLVMLSLPAMVLDAGRACRAMSGWEELWAWRPCTCCSLGMDMTCCPTSDGWEATSRVCWEGMVVGGKCGGLIFSAISCSLILSIRTRLSNCKSQRLRLTGKGHQVTELNQSMVLQENLVGVSVHALANHIGIVLQTCTFSWFLSFKQSLNAKQFRNCTVSTRWLSWWYFVFVNVHYVVGLVFFFGKLHHCETWQMSN